MSNCNSGSEEGGEMSCAEINNVVVFRCIAGLWNEAMESSGQQTVRNQFRIVELNASPARRKDVQRNTFGPLVFNRQIVHFDLSKGNGQNWFKLHILSKHFSREAHCLDFAIPKKNKWHFLCYLNSLVGSKTTDRPTTLNKTRKCKWCRLTRERLQRKVWMHLKQKNDRKPGKQRIYYYVHVSLNITVDESEVF